MTTEEQIDDAMIVTLSDYLDGRLSEAERAEVEKKIAGDPAWKQAHDEMAEAMRETKDAISGLQKQHAPSSFTQGVTQTIHKRSAGRFFARKTLGDRVPFGVLLVVALVLMVAVAGVLWQSSTGSLKLDRDKPGGSQGSAMLDRPAS
jgi:anti-sigma factor RsiW